MLLDDNLDRTAEKLAELDGAYIDSSSIIYAQKAGFLPRLSDSLRLWTIPGVIAEIGREVPGVQVLPSGAEGGPVDAQLFADACRNRKALISDDRELHLRADEAGVVCYNTLVMLECVLLKGGMNLHERQAFRKRLLAVAGYHPRVVQAADELHWAVRKRIG